MGCGASSEFKPPQGQPVTMYPGAPDPAYLQAGPKPPSHDPYARATEPYAAADNPTRINSIMNGAAVAPTAGHLIESKRAVGPIDAPKLLGKDKYVKEYGALVMEDRNRAGDAIGQLFLFCAPETDETVLVYRDMSTGNVHGRKYTDAQLADVKSQAGVGFTWAPFFKSLATALIKNKAKVTSVGASRKEVDFIITNSKEPSTSYPFSASLELLSSGKSPKADIVYDYVMEPLVRSLQYSRLLAKTSERDSLAGKVECDTAVRKAAIHKCNTALESLLPMIHPLREESAIGSHVAMTASRDVRNMEREIKAHHERQMRKHPLDVMYAEGGAQHFTHVQWSPQHFPHEEEPDEVLIECIRAAFPLADGAKLASIGEVLQRADIKRRIDESGNRQVIAEAFDIFKGIDQWDYDTIQLEIITNGNALFYTTYLLMYKLDLVSYFNIDDEVLRNFLVAVQSSYHPNPYHNAMHGADVTQINYYIMMVAGLAEKCKLSKEEVLAGLLAGPIHDFDHPGLNNNFHTRTNAYLAVLYNDRSILENHHLASAFELMRNPRYNVLGSLSDEQRTVVRDTMLEMVLATDMGNHAKIFKSFQVRMSETNDWSTKKEDVRLALSMSIKMADISNCARPNHIYAEWAKNISKEFYLQGDAERQLKLSISPFMDRSKEKDEFPKGQISFMMYIVQPMVEAISELLPSLSFAVNLCNENKEYWKRRTDETTE